MPKSKKFKEIRKALRKQYLFKPVPTKYQERYGKRYDQKDIESFTYAVAKSRGLKV